MLGIYHSLEVRVRRVEMRNPVCVAYAAPLTLDSTLTLLNGRAPHLIKEEITDAATKGVFRRQIEVVWVECFCGAFRVAQ